MTRELPMGWRRDRLKDVASLRTEKTKDKSDLVDYLELEDIESWNLKILNRRNTLEVESTVTLFNAGDVLFGKLRPYLAKVCRPDFDGKCTGEILAIRPTHVDGNYLKYTLIDPEMIEKCTEFSYGAKMPRVNWNTQLSTFEISLPPLSEQRRIAAFLDAKCADIDKAIAAKRKQLDLLEGMWKSILADATWNGINSNCSEALANARMGDVASATGSLGDLETGGKLPDSETPSRESKRSVSAASDKSEFQSLPQGWRRVKLKHTGTFDNGLTYSPSDIVESESDGMLVLRSSNIKDGKLVFDDNVYVTDAPVSLRVKKGDIIICSRNGSVNLIGKCAIVEHDIQSVFGAFMMRYRPKINARYAFYMFQGVVAKYKGMYATSTVNQITLAILSRMNTIIPPRDEQRRIAEYLDAKRRGLDELKDNLRRQIETLEQYRKSLIHECVTGERRVG